MIAHLLPSNVIPDMAQWGAISLTALGGIGILKRRRTTLEGLSWVGFTLGALSCVGMVGVAMLSPAPPTYSLSLALNKDVASPVQVNVCAQKPDGSAVATPDRDHVLAVLIDGVQVATQYSSTFALTVAPGSHRLRVELLTRDHREFNPVVAADTVVTVTGGAPLAPRNPCPR